jgi:DNA-3-methyladenine glycosylase
MKDAITVAAELLGKIIVRKIRNRILTAKIVETEAYLGELDPGSHAFRGITERNKVMFGTGGLVYIYFIYGNYFCFNVVCGEKGTANAVLIRAAEPLEGISQMESYRGKIKNKFELTNGPAKLCMAMNIDKKLYGCDLTDYKDIFISELKKKEKIDILTSKRIGLSKGAEFPYRFFFKGNPFVTRHKSTVSS